jgi:hypothetical protein
VLPTIVTVNPFMKHRRGHRAKSKRTYNRMRHRASGKRRSYNPLYAAKGHHKRRHRHHNPFSTSSLTGSLMPALIGAGGAIGTDVAMAYAAPYLPAMLQSGWANIAARAAVAVGVGYAAGALVNKKVGTEVAAGGLVVVAYSALKQVLAPTLGTSIKGLSGLADFGDYRPALPPGLSEGSAAQGAGLAAYMGRANAGMGAYIQAPRMAARSPSQMGAYMAGRMGYMNPASILTQRHMGMNGFGRFGAQDNAYQQDEGALM